MPLIARTIVLNFGHNEGKQIFARVNTPAGKGEEHKIIKTLCVIKAMMTWHQEKTGRICRERLGGAGYLTSNVVSEVLLGSHSGMTAEGDNKVLMQKVVKDILSDTQKKRHDAIRFEKGTDFNISSLDNLRSLRDLIYLREALEIKSIIKKLKSLIMEEGQEFFDVWMYQLNDDIQNLAEAFGERFFLQNAWKAFCDCKHAGAKNILAKVLKLHMVTLLKENLHFYMINDVLTAQSAKLIADGFDQAVKELAPHMNDCIGAFNLNQVPGLHGPIARDYKAFNCQRDHGALDKAGELFDPTKGPDNKDYSSLYRARL